MGNTRFNVLIAEDDLDDQEILEKALNEIDSGFSFVTVSNGIQLLDCLLQRHQFKAIDFKPDLILLDINMPIMDGFDVLKEIRKHDSLKQIPVYVVTSSRDVDHLNKALDLGASGFYHKGASIDEIRKIVKEVCGKCTSIPGVE